ncbi:MAG: SpoIVB peptidase [Ruminococcus sp.]|jgi:stage IV sporulation protein B|nr:SpoIVB peptidase [Ruminococcus sp.]
MGLLKRGIKTMVGILNVFVLALAGLICYYSLSLPDSYLVTRGGGVGPLPEYISFKAEKAAHTPVMAGETTSGGELILFGIFPVKSVTVFDIGTPMLIPSGEPFGIKMLADGAVVTDVNGFDTARGFASPAKDAGIRVGDIIKEIDGKRVLSNSDIVSKARLGKTVEVTFLHKDEVKTAVIKPAMSSGGGYKIGLWVKDSSAGIGTLTFYNAAAGSFAGLGHPVCDAASGAILPLYSGEAVKVNVNGIVRGRAGYPGELTGEFFASDEIGKLLVNDISGVYGELDGGIINGSNAIPLGTRGQIREGRAYIYTTVDGNLPTAYAVDIEKISGKADSGKDMVINVTDERLLKLTGGIIQGMSGSPIIQDGRLVGAVTHVFVNNPQKGYAIFADTMYCTSLSAGSPQLSNAA